MFLGIMKPMKYSMEMTEKDVTRVVRDIKSEYKEGQITRMKVGGKVYVLKFENGKNHLVGWVSGRQSKSNLI